MPTTYEVQRYLAYKSRWKRQKQVHEAHDYQPLKSVNKLRSGSGWTSVDILTFRILLNFNDEEIPSFMLPYFDNAKQTVKRSIDIKYLSQVLKEPWREWPRSK